MIVRFQRDEDKRRANIHKHGIDFAGVEEVFDGYTVTVEDDRFDYGERRFITVGLLASRVVTIVHTEEGDKIRIISVRKATKNESKGYYSAIPH